jgi:hypothetical protein
MSLRQLSTRIEVSFWQIIISLLSESRLLQRLVKWVYLEFLPTLIAFLQHFNQQRVIRWAAAGLGLGLMTGFLIAIF